MNRHPAGRDKPMFAGGKRATRQSHEVRGRTYHSGMLQIAQRTTILYLSVE